MLFLFVLLLSLTGMLKAQVTTAGMSGKVMADEESVIGATVVAVHEPSGTSYGTVTNVDGRFSLQGMRSGGPYKVTVSYIGYQTALLHQPQPVHIFQPVPDGLLRKLPAPERK